MNILRAVILGICVLWSSVCQAGWADWVNVTLVGPLTSVTGTLDGTSVTFTSPTQLNLGHFLGGVADANYWAGRPIYSTEGLPAPTTTDIIRVNSNGVYTLTFAQPVTNPIFAIVSLGGGTVPRWDFGAQPVTILKVGPGQFGNGTFSVTGNILTGNEAHGLVQFPGTMTSLTWVVTNAENWTGFTVGIPVVSTPPPPPVPALLIPVTLSWTLPDVVKNLDGSIMEITGYRVYRGLSEETCTNPTPLAEQVAEVVTLGATDQIPAELGPVCYEVTSLADEAESVHSTRAHATVGASVPSAPRNLQIQIGVR